MTPQLSHVLEASTARLRPILAHRAVGSLLHCVYVDTGFMKGETNEVRKMFEDMGIKLQVVDASDRFFSNLEGVTDPEEKRKVIGEQFIRVFEEEQNKCGAKFLVQGTIAPDWIESEGVREMLSRAIIMSADYPKMSTS